MPEERRFNELNMGATYLTHLTSSQVVKYGKYGLPIFNSLNLPPAS